MPARSRPIVVGVDGSPGTDAALQWAVDDAHARALPLRVIHAYYWAPSRVPLYVEIPDSQVQYPRHVAEQAVSKAIDRVRALDPEVEVGGEAVDGDPVRVLIDESEAASQVVLGSRHLKALGSFVLGSVGGAVSARSACPAVVVRGPAGMAEEGAGVVVGVDGTEASETVLGFGFEHASRHRVPLRAVLAWRPDLLSEMSWRVEPPPPAKVDAWLSEALAGWQQKYPDVHVHREVIREHPVPGLVLASAAQHLLVVGSHGHHARAGTLLGSVSQGVLHHATCPVAVVPTHRG